MFYSDDFQARKSRAIAFALDEYRSPKPDPHLISAVLGKVAEYDSGVRWGGELGTTNAPADLLDAAGNYREVKMSGETSEKYANIFYKVEHKIPNIDYLDCYDMSKTLRTGEVRLYILSKEDLLTEVHFSHTAASKGNIRVNRKLNEGTLNSEIFRKRLFDVWEEPLLTAAPESDMVTPHSAETRWQTWLRISGSQSPLRATSSASSRWRSTPRAIARS